MILLGRIRFCALILDLEKIDFLILKFIENTVLLTKIEKYLLERYKKVLFFDKI